MSKNCVECNSSIADHVFNYSIDYFGVPLCRTHQNWVRNMPTETTDEAIALYFELKSRGIPAELEKHDGYKTIDIAVTQAKINIEIDGSHHNWQAKQALSDLRRTYHSFKKGYFTLRIPNSLVRNHFEETADMIEEILAINRDKVLSTHRYKFSKRN